MVAELLALSILQFANTILKLQSIIDICPLRILCCTFPSRASVAGDECRPRSEAPCSTVPSVDYIHTYVRITQSSSMCVGPYRPAQQTRVLQEGLDTVRSARHVMPTHGHQTLRRFDRLAGATENRAEKPSVGLGFAFVFFFRPKIKRKTDRNFL